MAKSFEEMCLLSEQRWIYIKILNIIDKHFGQFKGTGLLAKLFYNMKTKTKKEPKNLWQRYIWAVNENKNLITSNRGPL